MSKVTIKPFIGFLILNVKDGSMRVFKKKPIKSKLSPFEIVVNIKIKVLVPEPPEITAEGEIEIPHKKYKEIVIHSI